MHKEKRPWGVGGGGRKSMGCGGWREEKGPWGVGGGEGNRAYPQIR